MQRKFVEAQLVKALDKNDSKAVREACLKLQAMKPIEDFFRYYYLNIDGRGHVYNEDSPEPFNYGNINSYIAHFLGKPNNITAEELRKYNELIREERNKAVEQAEKTKKERGFNPYKHFPTEFYKN